MPLSPKVQKSLFIAGGLVVLLLAVLLFDRINGLTSSFKSVSHTNTLESKLELALSYLKDAETGERGYLLTHDSAFLEPYIGARQRIDSMMILLQNLTKANATQQQNYYSLQSLINQQFDLLNRTLYNKDSLNIKLRVSKASMDRIRFHISQMKQVEKKFLKTNESVRSRYEKLTPLSLLFLVFAILAIMGFSYYGLTRQLQQTRKYADDLDFANRELQLKNNQLENSVEELNAFNYIASHDLKEPLRKILLFTDIITGDHEAALSATVKSHLAKIHNAGERMRRLLDDLLTYAQASMTERKLEAVDLNATAASVCETIADQLAETKAQVQFQHLPLLRAIPSQMQQLFQNLITNSLKYSKPGEPPVVNISSRVVLKKVLPPQFDAAHDRYHQICFSDNGIGFTQDNAEKVFELFQRLHQHHEFSGTGVGLTICRKIVQNHHGFITVESEVAQGTTFFVYLPA